jgi:SMC interacting uncharacterized protein involved in chromosome segregation
MTQKLASDAQIEKMEKELAKMRASLTESVQLMEQREMNTNIEWVLPEHREARYMLMHVQIRTAYPKSPLFKRRTTHRD